MVFGVLNSHAAEQHVGEAIDAKAPRVTLADLIAKPIAYKGKKVVVEGSFNGSCEDGDFYFKDKGTIIEVDPPSPHLRRGKSAHKELGRKVREE